jgi:chromosomal replication initiator protein
LKIIASATAKYYGLKLAELKSPLRRQRLVAARGVMIYLARQLTNESLVAIGSFLGGRDHTTILHGYQRIEKLLKRDSMTRHAVSELRRMLLST